MPRRLPMGDGGATRVRVETDMTVSPSWLAALRIYPLAIAGTDAIWEAAHLPLYTLWQTGTVGEKLFAVAHCTVGDVLIALASLILALTLVGHRDWPARRFAAVVALTLVFGFGYTVFSEWLNIVVRRSWAYSSLMPVVSGFGFSIGVSPLLQWIIVPILAFSMVRYAGSRQAGLPQSHPDKNGTHKNGVVGCGPTR